MKKLIQAVLLAVGMSIVSVSWAGEVADEVKEVVAETVSDKLVQYMDAAENVISQYRGEAIELGLTVLRIEAASEILPNVVGLVIGMLILLKLGGAKMWKWADKRMEEEPGEPTFFVPLSADLLGLGMAAGNIVGVLDVWAWVGIFYPEAYAVHKFLM